jgi:8-hydroxy-5-deazaflavin:NADPH oxidoreductase
MKIGILGAGMVGSHLARAFAKAGNEVMLSSRNPDSEKMRAYLADIPGGRSGTVLQTVAFGDIIVMAIGWQNGLEETLNTVESWAGKILVDTTNRFNSSSPLTAAEEIAELTGAPVVKAFNTIGAEHMDAPQFGDDVPSMFIAGHEEARQIVSPLIEAIGFDVVDLGGIEHTKELETLAQIWLGLAMRQKMGRNIAFKLLRK